MLIMVSYYLTLGYCSYIAFSQGKKKLTKGGERMLELENDWVKKDTRDTRTITYFKMDFYGPFLTLYLEKFKDETINATPISTTIETAEISESDFSLLVEASKELYSEFGAFNLKIPRFKIIVKIDSDNTEELILNALIAKIKSTINLI